MYKPIATVLGLALILPLLSFAQTPAVPTTSTDTTQANPSMMNKLRDKVNKIRDKSITKSDQLTSVQLTCLKTATSKR